MMWICFLVQYLAGGPAPGAQFFLIK
uniref:Uncharacterized protein n=1 Tax=Arundo donax TaxID=35708 RepID=A0A0A9BBA6_ARUDO